VTTPPDPTPAEPRLGYYEKGATTYFAAQCDQRFGYYLYVPRGFTFATAAQYRMAVVVHGTGRTPTGYRDLFADFAEAEQAIVVAPLFPAGIGERGELANYKFIAFRGIRYDEILLGIVAEVADRYAIAEQRFLVFGFSGGAHFAHRFAYLHPGALLGLSIGAPGMVTLIDDTLPWWRGTADFGERFGRGVDLAALRTVPVQMVVGAEDTETWEITIAPGSRFWMPGANDAGVTRIDRFRALAANFESHGIAVRLDLVPGVAHNGYAVLDPVKAFFAEVLAGHRADAGGRAR
jgi:pimeloyl-ACP methyl ester carboxylesterase